MNKEFTNEDIINAAKHCATNADCDNCPFFATLEIEGCIETFTRYIVNNTKKRACTVCQQHKLGGIKRYRFNITP